jgi:hypothetical protein
LLAGTEAGADGVPREVGEEDILASGEAGFANGTTVDLGGTDGVDEVKVCRGVASGDGEPTAVVVNKW